MKSNKTLFVRIFCLILAVIMLLLGFSGIVSNFYANAAEQKSGESSIYDENMQIRVGLIYGDSMTETFKVTATNGFSVGIMTDKRTFQKLGEFPKVTSATVLVGKKLTVDGKTVGVYHLQSSDSYKTYKAAYAKAVEYKHLGAPAYVAYVSGTYRVRVGSYLTSAAASSASLPTGVPKMSVVSSAASATLLYDNTSKTVVFECDTKNISLATKALQLAGDAKDYYTKISSGNLYGGILEFTNVSNKIRVINVLDLDTYALGVCPWEIYPTWPMETIKAFVCTIRTLAVYHYNARHNSAYGFDVCTTSHCQNYKGMTRDYENFRIAVKETAGQIVTYADKAIMGIYCGTNGGITEDVRDIWGGNVLYPYLTSVTIPIEVESHVNHPKGVWKSVVTPADLAKYLRNEAPYSSLDVLTSPIIALNIKKYSQYSGVYIYSLEFVDSAGHTATVNTSSRVRGALVKFCSSAYFSISYNYPLTVASKNDTVTDTMNSSDVKVLTANGEYTLSDTTPKDLTVLSAKGEKKFTTDQFTIQFNGKGNGHGGGISMYGAVDLAKAGYTYDTILSSYFPGVKVTDLGTPDKASDYANDGIEDGNDEQYQILATPCYKYVSTTANALYLRSKPSSSSTALKTLSKNTVLLCTGKYESGWARVYFPEENLVAYVSSDWIEAAQAPTQDGFESVYEELYSVENANVYALPEETANVVYSLELDTKITVVSKNEAWYRLIDDGGIPVYIKISDTKAEITPPPVEEFEEVNELVALTKDAYLKKMPADVSDTYYLVKEGTVLVRTGKGNIKYDRVLTLEGETAYIESEYLTTEVQDTDYTPCNEKVITVEAINLREAPSQTSASLKVVAKGTVLVRIAKGNNGWDKIDLDGREAFVRNDLITLYVEPGSSYVREVVKTTSKVNLRKGAGTDHDIVCTVNANTLLFRIEKGDGWDKVISPDGSEAYIKNDYIALVEGEYEGFVTVNETVKTTVQLNLRSDPSTEDNSNIITNVPGGTTLVRIGISSTGWSKVLTSDGKEAYASDQYLSLVS